MDVGFTGTKDGCTDIQLHVLGKVMAALTKIAERNRDEIYFHNGDCVGADKQSWDISIQFGWKGVLHPPIINRNRAFCKGAVEEKVPDDYMVRNRHIVDASQVMIACPNGKEYLRSGTWSAVRYARKKFKRIYIIYPDGEIAVEN